MRQWPHGAGLIEPIETDSCYLEMGASTFEVLAMHLALLGVDFEITEPEELVAQVARMADRYRRATGR